MGLKGHNCSTTNVASKDPFFLQLGNGETDYHHGPLWNWSNLWPPVIQERAMTKNWYSISSQQRMDEWSKPARISSSDPKIPTRVGLFIVTQ